MACFWSRLVVSFMVLMAYFSSLALSSQIHVSTISAAPAFLPSAPLASAPSLSPDITPLFPTPGGSMAPSPADSSLPTIPSTPSPPNPDDMLAPGPELAFPPSGFFPATSSVSLTSSGPLILALVLGLLVFCLMQLSGV